jgi:hypothetical protein
MSDSSISIVPKRSTYPQNETKAKEILDWLVSLDIIKPTPSDCILSEKSGYAISEGAREVVDDIETLPFHSTVNGLEIITERRVFDTGENGMEKLICPNCKQDISGEEWSFFEEWDEGKSDNITCPLCNVANDIHQFDFEPEWGFSDLGFRFWNWPPLNQSIINKFTQKLDCDVVVVFQHI